MKKFAISKQQIGRCGELFVQHQLLLDGIESSPLTTDVGIDLVAYSPRKKKPALIQVKTNLKPKPGGGKGKLAIGWWIPDDSPAELFAFVDLSQPRVWIFTFSEIKKLAQQHSNGRYHLYMYVDPTVKRKASTPAKLAFVYQFQRYLLENRKHKLF
jgi:hypothetical protein